MRCGFAVSDTPASLPILPQLINPGYGELSRAIHSLTLGGNPLLRLRVTRDRFSNLICLTTSIGLVLNGLRWFMAIMMEERWDC